MVIVDTSIIIDQLRRPKGTETELIRFIKAGSDKDLTISMITVQELFQGQSTKDQGKLQNMLAIISPLRILPYTYEIAQAAGEIIRDAKEPIQFADAAIAATAIDHDCQLFTFNKKDFVGIKALSLVELE